MATSSSSPYWIAASMCCNTMLTYAHPSTHPPTAVSHKVMETGQKSGTPVA
jgi:hypothetical protein